MLLIPTLLRPALLAAVSLLGLAACTSEAPKPLPPPVPDAPNAAARPFADYTRQLPAFSDDFSGSALDGQKWSYEVRDDWFNNEKQATTNSPSNLYLTGGELHIQARREQLRNKQFTSARIVTKGKMNYPFGRLDVRAKLPKGKGIWPAIWMLGTNDAEAGWPACGEIDIMELRGSQPNENITTIHYGPTAAARVMKGTSWRLPSGDFSDGFHVFSLVRSKGQMRWFVDGIQVFQTGSGEVTPYPFDNPFYLILNVAVGGDFDGDPSPTEPFPKEMIVDYVHFFQYAE